MTEQFIMLRKSAKSLIMTVKSTLLLAQRLLPKQHIPSRTRKEIPFIPWIIPMRDRLPKKAMFSMMKKENLTLLKKSASPMTKEFPRLQLFPFPTFM